MNKNDLSIALLLTLVASGCASTAQFAPTRLGETFPVRTETPKIQVFRSQTPTQKFTEIGAVNACCSRDVDRLIDLMRASASEHGGDAIIGLDVDATRGASASVIRFQ